MARPFFKVSLGGVNVLERAGESGVELTVTDGSGESADTFSLTLDDQNGALAIPPRGRVVEIIGGYSDNYRSFGKFSVDNISLSGFPQKLIISGQSADARAASKGRRTKGYDVDEYPDYRSMYDEVASRSDLQLAIDDEIASKPLEYEAQTEEDDLGFATRVSEKLNAALTIKDGYMVISQKGTGNSVSGKPLPTITIYRGNCTSYSCTLKDKTQHKQVRAQWFDRAEATIKDTVVTTSKEGPEYLIRQLFQSGADANEAAKAKADTSKRTSEVAEFTIEGEPQARAEAYVLVIGIRPGVDGTWRAKSVTHKFSGSSAYTTNISCEAPK